MISIGKKRRIKDHSILHELNKEYPFMIFKLYQRINVRVDEDGERTNIIVHQIKLISNYYEYFLKRQNDGRPINPIRATYIDNELHSNNTDLESLKKTAIHILKREGIKTIQEYEQESQHVDP